VYKLPKRAEHPWVPWSRVLGPWSTVYTYPAGTWMVGCKVLMWAPEIPSISDTWTVVGHLLIQVPIDVTAGWTASLVDTMSPFNSWVD